jgi:hypothetical protein
VVPFLLPFPPISSMHSSSPNGATFHAISFFLSWSS